MAENKQNKRPNVPPLRFPEFTEPWERYKLSEFATKITKKNRDNSISNVLSNSATLGIVQQSQYFEREIVTDENLVGYYVINEDDFVYNPRKSVTAPYGPVNRYYCKESGIISPLYLCFKVNGINKSFLLWFFKSPKWYRYIHLNGDSGVRHDRVSIKDDLFLDMPINVPSRAEQEKVSNLFELIDRRIAAQSKLIEDLKQLKSALVERLYCQHNPNFKIGDLVVQVSKRNRGDNDYSVLSVNNRLGFIEQSEQFEDRSVASEDTSNYKVVSRDDFAYNPARINVGSIARLTSFKNGIVSPMYICFHTKKQLLPQYLEYFFDTRYFYYEMQKRLEGSVRLCLSWEGLCNIPIAVLPIEQQEKVGKRISRLDDKISLEVSHLNLLKTQKQYLLQAMFI